MSSPYDIPEGLPKHKYTPLELPNYSFQPKGYEPWGKKPKTRLEMTHKWWLTDVRFNKRFAYQNKGLSSRFWVSFPGWRLGAIFASVFIVLDSGILPGVPALGIKKTYFDHHNGNFR